MPLPVINLKVVNSGNSNGNTLNDDWESGILQLTWNADPLSWQDSYLVSYVEITSGILSSSSSATDSLIASSGNNLNQFQNDSLRQQSSSLAVSVTTSTDSNVLVVQATKESIENSLTPIRCKLESLLPGRNYSVSVRSMSSGVSSNDTIIYHTMSMNKFFIN